MPSDSTFYPIQFCRYQRYKMYSYLALDLTYFMIFFILLYLVFSVTRRILYDHQSF